MYDPIEELIKERTGVEKGVLERGTHCPTERELWDYLNGLRKETEEAIASHLVGCRFCLNSLLLAQELRPGVEFGPASAPGEEIVTKAIAIGKKGGRKRGGAKKHLWLILSLLSIAMSFFLPRYFAQCLILGLLFGFKWVFDTMTTRTLIVMYEALRKKGTPVNEEVKERIEKRL